MAFLILCLKHILTAISTTQDKIGTVRFSIPLPLPQLIFIVQSGLAITAVRIPPLVLPNKETKSDYTAQHPRHPSDIILHKVIHTYVAYSSSCSSYLVNSKFYMSSIMAARAFLRSGEDALANSTCILIQMSCLLFIGSWPGPYQEQASLINKHKQAYMV
ncbi:hypothetical protein F5Y19DRAFT_172922 [Xylariaceae sp. FL1651]|nr:hypothetical protein F5Y19DRAFT_172922 [Xylariaceae sp. FL1651]